MTYQFSNDEQFIYDYAPERYFDGSLPAYVPTQLGTGEAAFGKIDIYGDEDIYALGLVTSGSLITLSVDGLVWDGVGFGANALSAANILVVDRFGNVVNSGSFFDSLYGAQQIVTVAPFTGDYYVVVDGTYSDGQYGLALSVAAGIPNTIPIAFDDFYTADEGTTGYVTAATGLLANDYDADGDLLAVTGFTYLGTGQLVVNLDGSFTYTPGPGFSGEDFFAYTVEDVFGAYDTGIASIMVSGDGGIIGTTGPDTRYGSPSDDNATLLGGDDTFVASSGVDHIDGGTGFDTIRYPEARSGFVVEVAKSGEVHVGKPVPGQDTLVGIERAEFTDGSLIFDLASENAAFVYRVYAAAYGRTPDEGGLRFWTDVMDDRGGGPPDSADQEFLAGFFLTADEFINLYGANPTDFQYVDAMYQNVLGRLPDEGGYDFWVGAMKQGLGRDDILISFAESGENVAQTAPDIDNGFWVL